MQSSQFILTLFVAAMLRTSSTTGFDWKLEADVEFPDNNAASSLPNALRRAQTTTDLSSTELDSFGSATSASSSTASTTTETDVPTTIMVLLPDHLAPSYSGSGSVMSFNGALGDEDDDNSKSAGSGTVGGEASNAASVNMAAMLTAFTILFASMMA